MAAASFEAPVLFTSRRKNNWEESSATTVVLRRSHSLAGSESDFNLNFKLKWRWHWHAGRTPNQAQAGQPVSMGTFYCDLWI